VFSYLKKLNPDVKRIHGVEDKNAVIRLSADMVDSANFKVLFSQEIEDIDSIKNSIIEEDKNTFSKKDFLQGDILSINALNEYKVDIVYLTYKEDQAEDNFIDLLKQYPEIKRLHGIKGLTRAFRLSADIVSTKNYVLIDGDNKVKEDFDLKSVVEPTTENTLNFYMTQNPVNDLIYGYGGIKVCPTINFRKIENNRIDPIASGGIEEIVPIMEVASITEFNTSPFNAWKAGFRESVMLTSPDEEAEMPGDEGKRKLEIWQTKGAKRKYGAYAIAGAKHGAEYGKRYYKSLEDLKRINDPEWLKKKFEEMMGSDNNSSKKTDPSKKPII
jgi:hypothetical protein